MECGGNFGGAMTAEGIIWQRVEVRMKSDRFDQGDVESGLDREG